MIRVEDVTAEDFERKRILTITGSEQELSLLEEALQDVDSSALSKGVQETFRRFRHSFESACCW